MDRQPIAAGQFYEMNPKKLEEQIKSSFKSKFGPGNISSKKEKYFAAVVPHAGYDY